MHKWPAVSASNISLVESWFYYMMNDAKTYADIKRHTEKFTQNIPDRPHDMWHWIQNIDSWNWKQEILLDKTEYEIEQRNV